MRNGIILLLLIIASTVSAQLQEEVSVDLVEVYVSALNSSDLPVTDLKQEDFVVKEDGVPQQISYFTRLLDADSQIPLTIGFLVDTSGSMSRGDDKLKRIDIARNFASLFLKEVKPADTLRIFAFDNVYRALNPSSSDLQSIEDALSKLKIDTAESPGTALLLSVDLTIKQLESNFGRKIIVVCSDGQNNIPGPSPEVLIETLKKKDITVLTLTTVRDEDVKATGSIALNALGVRQEKTKEAKDARKLMKMLAEESGGYAFFPKNDSKLNESIEQLRSIIRSQYAISFKPNTRSGSSWRKIDVECKRKGIKLQYRQGYFME